MRKVLVDASSARQGGGVTFASAVIQQLAARDFELFVLAPENIRRAVDPEGKSQIHWLKAPRIRALRILASAVRGEYVATRVEADVVLFLGNYGLTFRTPAVVVAQLDVRAGEWAPRTAVRQRLWWTVVDFLMKLSYKRARHVAVVSEALASSIIERYGISPSKITVIHEGVQPAPFIEPERNISVFAIAGPQPYKGGSVLAQALTQLSRKYGVRPHVAGVSREQASTLGWQGTDGSIQWLGVLSHEDILNHYRRSNIFVYQSYVEAFGLPPLEAMANGAAVVAPNLVAVREVCGSAAEFFEPTSPAALVHAVVTLLADDDKRRSKQKAGLERAKKFTWNATVDKLATIIRHSQVPGPE